MGIDVLLGGVRLPVDHDVVNVANGRRLRFRVAAGEGCNSKADRNFFSLGCSLWGFVDAVPSLFEVGA